VKLAALLSIKKWRSSAELNRYIAHLRQQCHNSKFVIFQETILKVLKYYNFLWVLRRQNCSPAASFANCVMTLYVLKKHLQTFLSTPITQKCQISICDTLVANERHVYTSMILTEIIFLVMAAFIENWRLPYATNDKNTISCLLNWRRGFPYPLLQ